MQSDTVTIRVPATTANLGPGFDCLALSLDLWNEAVFSLQNSKIQVEIEGEGKDQIPSDPSNLMVRAYFQFCKHFSLPTPQGLHITCINRIPLCSGLGSSAAATLAGLLAARELTGHPAGQEEILRLACEIEGHPDNAAAALYGGLVIVIWDAHNLLTVRIETTAFQTAIVLPDLKLPTRVARAAIPTQIPHQDAVYNLGRTALVVEALRNGDLELLGRCMDDRLHQPYRLKLIPGASKALQNAHSSGAAVALSGAGPSLVAFTQGNPETIAETLMAPLTQAGLSARKFLLKTTNLGALVDSSPSHR